MADEIRTPIARYLATDFVTWVVIIPLAFASLVTGLVLSLGTESGACFATTGARQTCGPARRGLSAGPAKNAGPGMRASATYRATPISLLCMSAASIASLAASRASRARRS